MFGLSVLTMLLLSGSEGKLSFPYQRIGMTNAIEELSKSPEGKMFNSVAPSLCNFLLSCYKEDGKPLSPNILLVLLLIFSSS